MKRRAFTMVELLVVIAIIGVLSTLLVIGIRHLQAVAKRHQTEQILANAQAMFNEWEHTQRISFAHSGVIASPQNVGTDLAPGNSRYGANVLFTREIMFLMRAMPKNAAALSKLPSDAVMMIPQAILTAALPTPAPPWADGQSYAVGDHASISSPNGPLSYVCIQPNKGSDGTGAGDLQPFNPPPNPAFWQPDAGPNAANVPVLLDAWGNPIIFVPAGLGPLNAGGRSGSIFSPDNRPFFASAGPDGDFSLGDDNIYSFEK